MQMTISSGAGCLIGFGAVKTWSHDNRGSFSLGQGPAWTRSCAACCRWPCFGRRVGL